MSTFLNDMVNKGYTKKKVLDVLFESEEEKERRRVSAIVTKAVDAIRLENVKEFLAYQQLATWRRMNGFDRVANDEKKWFGGHRSLPLTPEQYTASLWSEVNALKEAISMPAEDAVTRPRQKDSLDELLANVEYARIKECVEKRSREAAKVHVTVKPDGTVQHCSPCSPNPDRPSGVYFNLENSEDEMGPELEKLESSSTDTRLETPGQQCPPNEGVWETGRITANGFLTAGVDSRKKGNISSSTERAARTVTVAGISSIAATPSKRRHKTFSEENKQFDPGGQGDKARFGTRLYSTFFFWGELASSVLLSVCASSSVLSVCLFLLPIFFFFR